MVIIGHKSIKSNEFEDAFNSLPKFFQNRIKLLDNIPESDLLNIYQAARVFVYPSKAEGFGIPPLEAGAMKIPTYCSNTTAMSNFLFFGSNFFDPFNQSEITNILKKALVFPPNKNKLNNISLTIKENYSWLASAKKLISLITLNK